MSLIENINKIIKSLPAIEEASVLFSEEIVNKLEVLADMDIGVIARDLNKGNYLGNRKLDINIALNNDNPSEEVTYKSAILTLNNGINIPINFETIVEGGDTVVEEIASYTGLYTKILEGITAYNTSEADPQKHVVNFEIDVINQTIAELPTLLRIRDTDGSACNIDRITLAAYSGGSPKEQNPSYYWTKTTSSLEVLANRVGDIIALGENIDKIIALSDKEDEIQVLYDLREILQLLSDELLNIKAVGKNIAHVIGTNKNKANINAVNLNKTNIDLLASKINDNTIANAITAADTAIQKAQQTKDDAIATASDRNAVSGMKDETLVLKNETQSIRESIQAIAVEGNTLAEGQKVQIAYNSAENKFIFSIPKGDKGARGEAFKVNAMGLIAQKSSYDTQLKDFSFFATDTGEIYFKNTNASADWSVPIPFGKGERGKTGERGNGISSVIRVSGNGSAGTNDTYRITFTNGSTYEYNVYNGSQSDIKMADLITHKNNSNNPHSVNKNQLGLGNINNTSDLKKPISITQQNALNKKIDITNIINVLTSSVVNKPLSAAQGKVLKDLIDNLGITNVQGLSLILDKKLAIDQTAINSNKLAGKNSSYFSSKTYADTKLSASNPFVLAQGGDEGGQIGLEKAPNSTLDNHPYLDAFLDRLRLISSKNGKLSSYEFPYKEGSREVATTDEIFTARDGQVGSYLFLRLTTPSCNLNYGELVAGSNLTPVGFSTYTANTHLPYSGGKAGIIPTGTWKALGGVITPNNSYFASALFIRIA